MKYILATLVLFVAIYVGCILFYIFIRHMSKVFDMIDDYFERREAKREWEEINSFKKKL